MIIPVSLGQDSYNIILERGSLAKVGEIFDLDRRVFIVTDTGVPFEYADMVKAASKEACIYAIEAGEESKSLGTFETLCSKMLDFGLSRKDCVVAVGGGVVGDLAGFAAACFMRGIDFYNVPTTLLAQVDSSVGGKTAVDLKGIKNIVGAFHQPKAVLIDPEVLETLDERQFSCGAAEIIKIAMTFDKGLFELIEEKGIRSILDDAIEKAVRIKLGVVTEDEKETGLRKVLNFGHTLGHGIESVTDFFHGECVALGMIPMCNQALRDRLIAVLRKENLTCKCFADAQAVAEAAMHDKKASAGIVTAVVVNEIGTFEFKQMNKEDLIESYKEVF
ncbi:MAG: 3-dehydroquinate synthase [Firmicutes bacterium]|nr:3-dehydroquinate synthase [Bacillota bacterium]